MGVYIKGMEMPECCGYCPFEYKNYCMAKPSLMVESSGRHTSCPLVFVPPHWRLIDADALANHVAEKYNVKKVGEQKAFEMADFILFDIQNAPTIIPASEEGE